MVGQAALNRSIGVRLPVSQPSSSVRSYRMCQERSREQPSERYTLGRLLISI